MQAAVFFDQVGFFRGDQLFDGIVAGFGGNGGVEAIDRVSESLGEDGVGVGVPIGLGTIGISDDTGEVGIARDWN